MKNYLCLLVFASIVTLVQSTYFLFDMRRLQNNRKVKSQPTYTYRTLADSASDSPVIFKILRKRLFVHWHNLIMIWHCCFRNQVGCLFNLGLSHNCDYEAVFGKQIDLILMHWQPCLQIQWRSLVIGTELDKYSRCFSEYMPVNPIMLRQLWISSILSRFYEWPKVMLGEGRE